MAEKGFGVKEVNLIGASGTPTITSPNNLNLNAVNVAISTNVSIGGTLTVSGSLSIGGTVTYEDVTNIDAIGIITARSGIDCNSDIDVDGHTNLDNVSIAGVTTFSANVNISGANRLELGSDFDLYRSSGNTLISNQTGDLTIDNNASGGDVKIYSNTDFEVFTSDTKDAIKAVKDDAVKLYFNGNQKLETTNTGVTVTGTLAATAVTGDGSGLTGIAVTEAPVTDYTVTANGSSAYRFHGGGVDETADNPDLYLVRGQKYRFNNTTGSSHPFALRVSSGGSAYTDGVTGSQNGIQFFTVPYSSPASLVYQCTIHGGMVGNIYIRGGAGENSNVGKTLLNTTTVTNTNDQLTVKRPASGFGEMSMTVDANTSTSSAANAFIFTKSKHTYWNGYGFQSSHGHIGAIVGMRDSTGMNASHKMRIEIGGTGINASEEKTWDFLNTGNLSISDGDLVVANGHGIDFSSAAGSNAGSSSAVLDDYEEGVFVPTTNTNLTLQSSYDTFSYIKVGRMCTIRGLFYPNNSPSGNYAMTFSLPFAAYNYTQIAGAGGSDVMHRHISGASNGVAVYIEDGASVAKFYKNGGSSGWTPVYNTDWNSGLEIYIDVTYFTA